MRNLKSLAVIVAALASSAIGCAAHPPPALTVVQNPVELLTLDAATANRFVVAGARSELAARIRVAVPSISSLRRPPINLALVVDTSGSMEGRAIEDARVASRTLLESLHDGDRLSVITFDSQGRVLVPSTVLSAASRSTIAEQIAQIEARGTTAMAEGLRLGVAQVFANHDPAGINRIVLLGDGVPNDASGILETAQAAGARGVAITTLGLGLDYDETLMGNVAQRSGGHFHFVEDSSAVAAVFRDEVLRMERVVGRNAVAVLNAGPGVEVQSVVGLSATRTDEGIVVPLGDVSEGSTRDLVVRLSVPSRRNGASVELLDVTVRYVDALQGGGQRERRAFVGVRASSNEAELRAGRNEEVERTVAAQQLASNTLEAIRDARSGNLAAAQQRLDQAIAQAEQQARVRNDVRLQRRVASLRGLRGALPSVAPSTPSAPAPEAAPATAVRAAHDEAMSELSGD
ncbi:MAG: VWA domain-containing protein [Myxococcales bacterium]|nr:VWA domain-containing protein [Myxococcales bacterium]